MADPFEDAFNAGYSYSDVSITAGEADIETPAKPSLDNIMATNMSNDSFTPTFTPTPEEDSLQRFGPQPLAPSISDTEGDQQGLQLNTPLVTDPTKDPLGYTKDVQPFDAKVPGSSDKVIEGGIAPWERDRNMDIPSQPLGSASQGLAKPDQWQDQDI